MLTSTMVPSASTTTMASGAVSRSWRKASSPKSCVGAGSDMRQPYHELCARLGVLHPDLAAMRLDGELAEGETEAVPATGSSVAVYLDEALEDFLAHLGRDAVPGV